MSSICSKQDCTCCGLCTNVCPKKCISFSKDDLGVQYPNIDKMKCISCHLCEKNCPSIQKLEFNEPKKVYAAWSNDNKIINHCTSGGIAQELYKYALNNGYSTYGVSLSESANDMYIHSYIKIKDIENVNKVIGSKYVQADLTTIFTNLEEDISNDKKVLFIGLPCHVSAIKMKFAKAKKLNNLITVDIVCHGVAPYEYLNQHIKTISNKLHKQITKISFRNFDSSYYLNLYDKKLKKIYSKTPNQDDVYYRGYMENLILRENCYNCHYAKNERISDITIGDFDVKNDRRIINQKKVSLLLVSSLKGVDLIQKLINNSNITVYEQVNIKKSLEYNNALNYPSAKNTNRELFEQKYKESSNFEKSSKLCLKQQLIRYKLFLIPNLIKTEMLKFIPQSIKNKLKRILKK